MATIKRKGQGIQFVLPPTDVQEPEAPAAPVEEVTRAPRTGVGLVTASVFEGRRLQDQVAQLEQQKAELLKSQGAQRLDPNSIAESRWANRHPDAFDTQDFADLRAEIAAAGGNVQPIKVRPLKGAKPGEPQYEIVFGHRRRRACADLRMPVWAIVEDLDDRSLFEQMDRENRHRRDLSAFEQGQMYLRALDEGLYPSMRQLAEAVGSDIGRVSRAVAVVKLPPEVIAAFPSPISITYPWVTALSKAAEKDAAELISRAKAIAEDERRPEASEVFKALVSTGKVGAAAPAHKFKMGKTVGELRLDATGKLATLQLPASALPPERWKAFEKLVKDFVAASGDKPV